MGFPVKLFTTKGNLVFMNNLYSKVAVASVWIALSFTLVIPILYEAALNKASKIKP
jgi:hypothetical protein